MAGYLMNNFPTLYEESCLALSALKFLLFLPDKLYQSRKSLGFDPSILQHIGFCLGWSRNFVGSESGQVETECKTPEEYCLQQNADCICIVYTV